MHMMPRAMLRHNQPQLLDEIHRSYTGDSSLKHQTSKKAEYIDPIRQMYMNYKSQNMDSPNRPMNASDMVAIPSREQQKSNPVMYNENSGHPYSTLF